MSQENVKAEREVTNAATEVIQFALANPSRNPMEILRLWNEGDFDAIKEGWPDAPNGIFDQI